jgi:DNA-binding transcriptional MocR family regulator
MPDGKLTEESRSMKPGQWYWADKAVVQKYTKKAGALAVTVYHFLASMADESQTCYPSQRFIAERIGYSRSSVNRAVMDLVEIGLIEAGKRKRDSREYRLLNPRCLADANEVSHRGNRDAAQGDTNNNQEQDINNNTFVRVHKSYTKNNGLGGEGTIQSKEELLAHDLAEALSDQGRFSIYLSYAKRYSEHFLRRILAETEMTPEKRIRKSRAALFNYLLHHYAGN